MKVSDFELEGGIESEPDFVWWVPFNLNKIDRIIDALIEITKRVSHNYGVKLTSTVQ